MKQVSLKYILAFLRIQSKEIERTEKLWLLFIFHLLPNLRLLCFDSLKWSDYTYYYLSNYILTEIFPHFWRGEPVFLNINNYCYILFSALPANHVTNWHFWNSISLILFIFFIWTSLQLTKHICFNRTLINQSIKETHYLYHSRINNIHLKVPLTILPGCF